MLNLDAVATFIAIAATGSFTGAARQLALSKSVVSERLKELEQALGTRLVQRTTRRVALTADGVVFHERAVRIVREAELAAAELADRRGRVTGTLRISAPVSFGHLHLGEALFAFIERYPSVDLRLDLEDRFVDINHEGYDAVVRHGPVEGKRVVIKTLARSSRLLVASPAYLKRYGTPGSLEELKDHRGIMYSYRGASDWRFQVGRRLVAVQPQAAMRVNNGLLMRDAAIRGLGIALLPTWFLDVPLKSRKLAVVDVGARAEGATLHLAYPDHLRASAKIRALSSWLQKSFGDPPHWERLDRTVGETMR